MKKILLLGGSSQQVIAIETAKRLGYYTVLCDYLPDNPGQYEVDKFYLLSTTDKDAVLEDAKDEKIDGVIAYASDPAAPTAAYIAEKMGLSGNPYKSVDILCNKDKFRKFLKENGFCTPNAKGYTTSGSALIDLKSGKFQFPIIVKPVDSSGSKGVTVLYDLEGIDKAFEFALSFSRRRRVIIEEYIEKKHPYLIGGDIFVLNGQVVMWGLMNCHRDLNVNPLVPVGKSYPPLLVIEDLQTVKNTLQKIVTDLGFQNGCMNIELVVDKHNRVFLIDIGPRAGGNMIPDLCGYIFGVDVIEMAVKAVMGEEIFYHENKEKLYYATHNLHSTQEGIFDHIELSKEIEKFVIKKCIFKKNGDRIECFDNASKCLGVIFMKFGDEEEMKYILNRINNYVSVKLEGGGNA